MPSALVTKLRKQPEVRDAEALAAWIGRYQKLRKAGVSNKKAMKLAGKEGGMKEGGVKKKDRTTGGVENRGRKAPSVQGRKMTAAERRESEKRMDAAERERFGESMKERRERERREALEARAGKVNKGVGRTVPPTALETYGNVLEPGRIRSSSPARKLRYDGNDYEMRNTPSAEVGTPQTFVIDHPKGEDRFVLEDHRRGGVPPSAVLETYPRFSDQDKFEAHKGALTGSYDPQNKRLVVERYGDMDEVPDKNTLRKLKDLYPIATKVVFGGEEYRLPPRRKRT